jgi:outer membrane receptor protein involved in Fe transport
MRNTLTENLLGSALTKVLWLTGSLLISLGLSSQAFAAASDTTEIEEVVVTGSYLKSNAADSPSPLSIVTSADIEDLGAADVAEVIRALPWNSGSQTTATTFQGGGSDGRTNINLRNLGHGATLPLINGKRHVPSWYNPRGNASTNINALVPNIAIESIEIVKDGASALYGSDAVAGVVNFLTKSEFEGFDVSYQFTTDDETGQGDAHQGAFILGVQGGNGGIVASASFLNRDEINVADNYKRFGGTTISSTGQPGRLTPIAGQDIIWAAHGLTPGEFVDPGCADGDPETPCSNNPPRDALGSSFGQADVNCEDAAALTPGNGGALGNLFNRCVYDYGSFFSIQSEEQLRNFFIEGHYDLTPELTARFELASNSSEFDRLNSLNPNAPALTIPTEVPYIGADGNVLYAANPGSVEDAFRRGIEPLEYANLTRLQGYSSSENGTPLRPVKTFTDVSRSDQRLIVGLTYDVELAERQWTIDATYTASNHNSAVAQVQDTISSHMELAINGLGGPNCDVVNGVPGSGNATYAATDGDFDAGTCYFFNPFGNSAFNRDGSTFQENLELVNPAELYEWLIGRASSDSDFRQRVIDIIATGELWETDSGPIGIAVGFQQRRDEGIVTLDSSLTTDNLDFVFGADDWAGQLTTNALFVELGIPLGDLVEVNVAGRYEDFDEIGENTVDPKITVLFRPLDSLTLRASAGSSFKVPSLLQTFGALTTVANQADLVGGTTFKPSITQGNPNLKPESADTVNVGVSWAPNSGALEGLSVNADIYNIKYEDIITREASATLLREDNEALMAWVIANVDGATCVAGNCPEAFQAVNAGIGNRDQIVRNSSGILLRILPDFANANGADVRGLDLDSSYRFDNDWGNWRVGFQAAWIETFDVEVPNRAGGVTVFDGVGNYNMSNPVARPLPEWKLNASLGWSLENHRVFALLRHTGEVDSDIPAGTRGFFAGTARLAGNDAVANDLGDDKIESFTTLDVQYNYNFGEVGFLNDATFTFGIQNLWDEEAPHIAVVTAFDPRLHDGRGRLFFTGIKASM